MKFRLTLYAGIVFLMVAAQTWAADTAVPTQHKKISIDIGSAREEKEVGLKRMEILEKSLSPELLQKKRMLVQSVENDYTRKIGELLQPLTTSIGKNTIICHVDINFLDPDFESQIQASQRVSVSIIMGRAGFENWAAQGKTEPESLDQLKQMLHATFKIPKENITIMVGPN